MTATTAEVASSRRAITRERRRRARARVWRQFRANRGGMVGLAIMTTAVALALLAPVFFDKRELDVVHATGSPLETPSMGHWLGTDDSGRDVLALCIWGARISLLVGFAATVVSMLIGTTIGIMAGH